jgi:hypothetical protein
VADEHRSIRADEQRSSDCFLRARSQLNSRSLLTRNLRSGS